MTNEGTGTSTGVLAPEPSAVSTAERPAASTGNHDIWMQDDIRGKYPLVEHLYSDPVLERVFGEYDAEALRYKRLHTRFGKLALYSAGGALLLALAELAGTALGVGWPGAVSAVALGAGLLPLVIEGGLRWSHTHDKWMAARVRTELIRQWRYQQFLDGVHVESDDRAGQVEERDRKLKEAAQHDFEDPSALDSYLRTTPFSLGFRSTPYTDPETFKQAMGAYWHLRLDYQRRHFDTEAKKCERRDRASRGLARWFLRFGLLATVGEAALVLTGVEVGRGAPSVALPVIALTLLVLTVVVRVYRAATGLAEESERYSSRASHLLRLSGRFKGSDPYYERLETEEDRRACMEEVERECWQELFEFLKLARKSNYFI